MLMLVMVLMVLVLLVLMLRVLGKVGNQWGRDDGREMTGES